MCGNLKATSKVINSHCSLVMVQQYVNMGARRGGQEGALAPPGNSQIWGAPTKDNLTRNFLKKLRGPHIASEETDLGGPPIASKETDLRGPPYSM